MEPRALAILIVDENRARSTIIEEGLRDAGHERVHVVREMQGLVREIEAFAPDVIVVDLENPNRDRLEQFFQVTRSVRRPIAMFVDRSDAASMEAAIDAGVSAYVVDGLKKERVKPILDMAILRFGAYSRLQRELDEARSELADRKVIEKAKGLMMGMRGLSEEEAYRLLRQTAMNEKTKLVEIARAVVTAAALLGGEGGEVSGLSIVRAGFIPLLDAAVLVAASAMGFDRREGVVLELVREVSWSNIRDRLAFRQFDVAHLLGPMAVASQLGLGSNPYPVIAPMALGRGGNAITLSMPLYSAMREAAGAAYVDEAGAHARALATVVAARREAGLPPLVFAMTYPFSSHNYEFRFWMAEGGIDPDRDVTMTVVPPPLTADALKAGAIDGFCVNAPWNVLAVEAGIGRIVAVKADVWPSSPEKVLGLRPDWWSANRDTAERLLVALDAAARWCDAPDNRGTLADILARPEHVGGSAETIAELLAGRLPVDADGTRRTIPDYLTFHAGAANFPWSSQALWVYAQMVRWGQVQPGAAGERAALAAFRPDLYRDVFGSRIADLPAADTRIEGEAATDRFSDGRTFDPEDVVAYVEGFPIRHRGLAADRERGGD